MVFLSAWVRPGVRGGSIVTGGSECAGTASYSGAQFVTLAFWKLVRQS